MKKIGLDVAVVLALAFAGCRSQEVVPASAPDRATVVRNAGRPQVESAWRGKKVAFLGDSITDPQHVGCTANYWNYLPDILGLEAWVYGRNGWQMNGVLTQAGWLQRELGDEVDAIFVLAGTNDFNGSVPRGAWYDEREEETPRSQGPVRLRRRTPSMDEKTFRGRLNRLLSFLKHNFPRQQIVLMTALHRGYAAFGPTNVQPDESFANLRGDFIGDFNDDIREAGRIWSVPVLDLFATSGLYPLDRQAYANCFHDAEKDMLHPSAEGHRRIARTMAGWMLTVPSDFKGE